MPEETVQGRRRDWFIPSLLLFAILLRLAYHIQYSVSPFWGDLAVDEQLHNVWASYIAGGNLIGDSAFFRAPLYAYFLALLYAVLSPDLHVILCVQHLIGVATGWLLYKVAKEMFSYTTGALALIIYLLTPVFIYFEGQLLLDFLILPLNLLALLFLTKAVKTGKGAAWLQSGAFFGLSALARPNILFVMPFLAAWVFIQLVRRQNLKRAFLATAGLAAATMAVIAPVTVRNYIVSNDLVLIAAQGGINFYVGNNPEATGLAAYMPGLGSSWDYQDCEHIAEQATGKKLLPSQVSDYWYSEGLKFMLDEPEKFVELFLKKLYHLLNNHEISNNRSIPYVYDAAWMLRLLPMGIWFVIPFAAVGAFSYRRDPWVRLLILFVTTYSFTLLMFFINSRFRLPVLVICTILAALGLQELIDKLLRRRYVRASGVILVAAAISLFTLGNRYNQDFENAASEEFNLGNHLLETGRYDEALARYHNALERRPTMNLINLNIGNVHLKLGNIDSARAYYLRELDVTVDPVRAYNNLGVVARLAGNDSLAIEYGSKAIALKPYFADAAINYVIAARKLRLYSNAFRVANAAIEAGYADPDLHYYRGVLYFDLGRFNEARTDFNSALELVERDRQPSFGSVFELRPMAEKAEARRRTKAMVYYSLGTIAGQTGMPDSARVLLTRAVELDRSLTEAKVNLASALTQLGEFEDAERIALEVIESGKGNALVWYFIAISRVDSRMIDQAEQATDSSLAFDPGFEPALALKRLILQRKEGGN